jgi:mRNA interferase HigB
MTIVNRQLLDDLVRKHANASNAVCKWIMEVEKAQWKSFVDVRNTFSSADYVGNDHVIFNLQGNHFRIVAIVVYVGEVIYIRWSGTHSEYNKVKNCSII